MSFVQRRITLIFALGTGDFGDGSSDTVTVEGLRCSAQIVKGGLPGADTAQIRVWGLTISLMNKLTDLGKPIARVRNNQVTVLAGDDLAGMATVYQGNIQTAYGDFSDPPNACLSITSLASGLINASPVTPLSFPGGSDVATIAAQIAANMKKGFVNWGVSGVILSNQYLPGTAGAQLQALVSATGIGADANGQNLEIWPATGTRGGAVVDIGPMSGLVGYPEYCDRGLAVKILFQFGIEWGAMFNLTTSVTNAAGSWQIQSLDYDLASEVPDGPWFIEMTAIRPNASGGGP